MIVGVRLYENIQLEAKFKPTTVMHGHVATMLDKFD